MSPAVPTKPINKRPIGRPPALDVTKREVAVALVAVGCTRTQAARYLEVSPQTLANTARRDPEFGHRLDRVEANLQCEHLRKIGTSDARSWRASAWALQQLSPERFTDSKKQASLAMLQLVLAREISDPVLRGRLFERLKGTIVP